jgi:hypothetical protein
MNPSPVHLFERALAIRPDDRAVDWYQTVAPTAYETFYSVVRDAVGDLPQTIRELTPADRLRIKEACKGQWPEAAAEPAAEFAAVVAEGSASAWNRAAGDLRRREVMLWRLLRLHSSPYFILGSSGQTALRLRIATPWDWRQEYQLLDFEIAAQAGTQPRVGWVAKVERRAEHRAIEVRGHVEVRWSHGRFCGMPEAKVYLDSPHHLVPGYEPLQPIDEPVSDGFRSTLSP